MRSKGSHSIDAKICKAKKARTACLLNESIIKIGMHKCTHELFGWKSDAQLKSTYCMDAIVTLFLAASVCTIAPVLLYYPHRLLWIQAKDCWSLQWYHAQQCESSKCHFCCWDQKQSRGLLQQYAKWMKVLLTDCWMKAFRRRGLFGVNYCSLVNHLVKKRSTALMLLEE